MTHDDNFAKTPRHLEGNRMLRSHLPRLHAGRGRSRAALQAIALASSDLHFIRSPSHLASHSASENASAAKAFGCSRCGKCPAPAIVSNFAPGTAAANARP